MSKTTALIKACAFDNMSLFKIGAKKQSSFMERLLPLLFTLLCFAINWIIAETIIKELIPYNLEIVLLTLFIVYTSMMTIVEGIYKSSGLLFNCRDDNFLFSIPIKKSVILSIRVLKFYIFELFYNSLFLIPAMIVYAIHVDVSISYYITSALALLLLPIIPIVISSVIGGTISAISSRFKFKTFVEIVVTGGSLIAIFLILMNFDQDVTTLVEKAKSSHTRVMNLYFPAKQYINLILDFNIKDVILFIISNLGIVTFTILILSKIYYKVNSRIKIIKPNNKNKKYKIKTNSQSITIIKKELKKFFSSPIYVTNSTFGLAIFIIGSIFFSTKFDSIVKMLPEQNNELLSELFKSYTPVAFTGLISFISFTTFITCSMISLEGKAFNILKSMPIKPFKVVLSKIEASLIIILPFLFIGDAIVFASFKFSIFETLLIIAYSIVLPAVAETIGIIINLKYPRMDAENDTQVIKQSTSSTLSVFSGMLLIALNVVYTYVSVMNGIDCVQILLYSVLLHLGLEIALITYLGNNSTKEFYKIS